MSDVNFIFFDHPLAAPLHEHWRKSVETLLGESDSGTTVICAPFENLSPDFDCLVSPANSYGIMDGGVDMVYSQTFRARDSKDHLDLSRTVQDVLAKKHFGFAPPGSCTLVPIPEHLQSDKHPKCKVLAVSPTMRIPTNVSMVEDLVYNTMWALLVELEHWNAAHAEDGLRIRTVAIPGMATGIGMYDKEKSAYQMVLAVKHFRETCSPEGRRRLEDREWTTKWDNVIEKAMEVVNE